MSKKEIGILKVRNESGNCCDIMLYGVIDALGMLNSGEFAQHINYCIQNKIICCNFYVNSLGGDVFEGVAMRSQVYRALNNGIVINWYIDGIALSMMAVLCSLPGTTCYAPVSARMMFHQVQGGAQGTSDMMRQNADLIDGYNKDFISDLCKKTGMSA